MKNLQIWGKYCIFKIEFYPFLSQIIIIFFFLSIEHQISIFQLCLAQQRQHLVVVLVVVIIVIIAVILWLDYAKVLNKKKNF